MCMIMESVGIREKSKESIAVAYLCMFLPFQKMFHKITLAHLL